MIVEECSGNDAPIAFAISQRWKVRSQSRDVRANEVRRKERKRDSKG